MKYHVIEGPFLKFGSIKHSLSLSLTSLGQYLMQLWQTGLETLILLSVTPNCQDYWYFTMPNLCGLVSKLSPHHHKAAPLFALDSIHSQYEVTRGMDTDGGKEDAQDIERAKEKISLGV